MFDSFVKDYFSAASSSHEECWYSYILVKIYPNLHQAFSILV